ncbi:MAG TPA: squalene synthase HpnC [Candidatus Acidoferrum sp.]|nr:squalene synthase HpnC [Candidatus Acidoferrum sp.]
MSTATVETPSGKSTATENFPVGSFLLPAPLRPHVATFYGFARTIDDIADNPQLAPDDKIARLDGFAAALTGKAAGPGFEKAERLRESLAATGVTPQHGLDLVAAFKLDAVKLRYADWNDLIEGYCMLSAAPVGRYLLDLHGEARSGYRASDALCNALQVLNHLQDCQDDYRQLNRVYLPQDWLAAAGSKVEELDAPAASPGVRRVIDRCLDGTDELIAIARTLPGQLKSRRLAMESAVIVRIAERLSRLLRRRDPLAGRVKLSGRQFLGCAVSGIAWALLARRP